MRKILLALSVISIAVFDAGATYAGDIVLQTPTGLHVGDQFRFVFLTDAKTNGITSNIAWYDNVVNTEANVTNNTTYQGQSLTWKVIGSTAYVNAIDHIGGPQSAPVYGVNGNLVASSTGTGTGGLWSGTLQSQINADLSGHVFTQPYIDVLTGTNEQGTVAYGTYAGNSIPFPLVDDFLHATAYGEVNAPGESWTYASRLDNYGPTQIYGISQIITVQSTVPEPSTVVLAGMGCAIGIVTTYLRNRRKQLGYTSPRS